MKFSLCLHDRYSPNNISIAYGDDSLKLKESRRPETNVQNHKEMVKQPSPQPPPTQCTHTSCELALSDSKRKRLICFGFVALPFHFLFLDPSLSLFAFVHPSISCLCFPCRIDVSTLVTTQYKKPQLWKPTAPASSAFPQPRITFCFLLLASILPEQQHW